MSNLNNNTTQLELLLAKVNALPEAGGSDTSDATATADEIFAGKTAYTADGKVTGTFTIAEELTEQNNLISQISTLVATKANPQGGTEDLEAELTTQENLISQLGTILDNKASGGSSGGSVETCAVSVSLDGPALELPTAYYTDSNMTAQSVSLSGTNDLTVPIGTLLVVKGGSTMNSIVGDGELMMYYSGISVFKINGAATIAVVSM